MNYTAYNTITQLRPEAASTSSNGNCGGCGSPILFMNVMLCDTCLKHRLDELHRIPAPA